MRFFLVVAFALALVALPVLASAEAAPGPCAGDPYYAAACGCPDGFWGVTLYVSGEPQSFVCFF